jgi:hypothetical protein
MPCCVLSGECCHFSGDLSHALRPAACLLAYLAALHFLTRLSYLCGVSTFFFIRVSCRTICSCARARFPNRCARRLWPFAFHVAAKRCSAYAAPSCHDAHLDISSATRSRTPISPIYVQFVTPWITGFAAFPAEHFPRCFAGSESQSAVA